MRQKKVDKKEKSNRGRKPLWDEMDMPNKLNLIEDWARNGMIEKDMMEQLGVSKTVFYQWKAEKQEFKNALNKGKEIVDALVESTLLKKAMGYTFDEVTKEPQPVIVDGKMKCDEFGIPIMELKPVKVVTKEVQPSDTAIIFWLKNRRPAEWRDKQHVEHSGGVTHQLTQLSDEELEKALAKFKE